MSRHSAAQALPVLSHHGEWACRCPEQEVKRHISKGLSEKVILRAITIPVSYPLDVEYLWGIQTKIK